LRAYLPTCLPGELRQVFGPVDAFVVPGDDPQTAITFRLDDGVLSKDLTPLQANPVALPDHQKGAPR
jgi:hypothetical protein